ALGGGTNCARLWVGWWDGGCRYPVSSRIRGADYSSHSAVGNWSIVTSTNCGCCGSPMAAAQGLGTYCCIRTLPLRNLFRPVQHRSQLHDCGASKSRTFNPTSSNNGCRRATRNRAVDEKKNSR